MVMKFINKILRNFFKWIFKKELDEIQSITIKCNNAYTNYIFKEKQLIETQNKINNLLSNIDISVDVHKYSPSWAVISIQGEKQDYIKFVNLGKSDIREIANFISKYDRAKVDATPQDSNFIKFSKYERF